MLRNLKYSAFPLLSQVFHLELFKIAFHKNENTQPSIFGHFISPIFSKEAGGLEVFKVFSSFSEKAADLHRWQNMNIFPHFTLVMHTFLSVQYQTMESQMRSYKHYKHKTYYWCQTLNILLVQNTKNTEIIKFSNQLAKKNRYQLFEFS